MRNILARFSGVLMAAACVAPGFSRAAGDGYSDADIKEKFVFISRLIHGDENGSHIKKALRMAGNDTKERHQRACGLSRGESARISEEDAR